MSFGPKKDGSPNVEYFQQPDVLGGLETVRLWLQKNFKKVRFFQPIKNQAISGAKRKMPTIKKKIVFLNKTKFLFSFSVRSSGKSDKGVSISTINSIYATSGDPIR